MPTIGPFHRLYWRARANPVVVAPPGQGGYPLWQSSIVAALGPVGWFEAVKPYWGQFRWMWAMACRLWWMRGEQRGRAELWIDRVQSLTDEQHAILERSIAVLNSPYWLEARQRVRECAQTRGFHHPQMWTAYSRALRENAGQAQNVYRHIKVVHELKAAHPELSNPEAHLITELGYQGFALEGRAGRRVITH